MFKNIIIFFIILHIHSGKLLAENIDAFEFTEEGIKKLELRKVRGAKSETNYSVNTNENGNYLIAQSNGGASGLGKELKKQRNINTMAFTENGRLKAQINQLTKQLEVLNQQRKEEF